MRTKRTVIVQCRLSSTRLPQKALLPLGQKTVLDWVLSSMKRVKADNYFVATDQASFEQLKPVCDANGFSVFAGDLENVLRRFCDLVRTLRTDVIIRATADNPFLFYEAAQASALEFEDINSSRKVCDYLTYTGLPHGSGVEIFSAQSLLAAELTADSDYDREHVGPAFYNHKDKYNCMLKNAPSRFYFPELRTTIDTYSDYLRACAAADYLLKSSPEASGELGFSTEQILDAFRSREVLSPVVYAPSVVKGQGTGHLRRCLDAAAKSGGFVYIPDSCTLSEAPSLVQEFKSRGLRSCQVINSLPDQTFPATVVSDGFSLTREQASLYKAQKALVAVDEGSSCCDCADYLLDIIPSYKISRRANLFDSDFIELPHNVRTDAPDEIKKILICMGGEDPESLTEPCARELAGLMPGAEITAVSTDSEKHDKDFEINYIPPVRDLKNSLFDYDLVVTHYGFTAFEARAAGCLVILVSPTPLHQRLAQEYGFACIPYGKISRASLQELLKSPLLKGESTVHNQRDFGEFVNTLAGGERMPCPVCRSFPDSPDEVVSRNVTRTYRRCSCCGMVYMSWSVEPERLYHKAYFFEEYKNQYGKTYQEDFENIKAQCLRRVDVINSIKKGRGACNVLDIGCAYGPFLSAAGDKGLVPFGTDISEDAVNYVKSELRFPCCVSAFPDIDIGHEFGISSFDVVTMWYVIEHFKDLKSVLEKVSQIVKPGGIFAFSTPSGEGISAASDVHHFYTISPTDHFSVWEPSRAAKILRKFGFEVVKLVSTGHHPERFPSIKKSGAQEGSLQWTFTQRLSRMQRLGDTFEVYCRRVKL